MTKITIHSQLEDQMTIIQKVQGILVQEVEGTVHEVPPIIRVIHATEVQSMVHDHHGTEVQRTAQIIHENENHRGTGVPIIAGAVHAVEVLINYENEKIHGNIVQKAEIVHHLKDRRNSARIM